MLEVENTLPIITESSHAIHTFFQGIVHVWYQIMDLVALMYDSLFVQGAEAINGLVTSIEVPANKDAGKYNIKFQRYSEGSRTGVKDSEEFDLIIGSDGANSRVAKVCATKTA